jgi:hypothetical protein
MHTHLIRSFHVRAWRAAQFGSLALSGAALLGASTTGACGDSSTGASRYADATFSIVFPNRYPTISLTGCSLTSLTGTGSDDFNRTTSYTAGFDCGNSDSDVSATVSNIAYGGFGWPTSFNFSIGGSSCGRGVCDYDSNGNLLSCRRDG